MKYSGSRDIGHLVEWAGFSRVQDVAADTLEEEGIALIYGSPGVGKTLAIRHFATHLAADGRPRVVEFAIPRHCTVRRLTRELLKGLIGVYEEGDTLKLQDKVLVELEQPTIVIFDEADRAARDEFEYIRDLHDRASTRLTALLVGSPEAYDVLERHPLLFDRVESRCEVPKLTEQQVRDVLPAFHDLYTEAEEEAIKVLIDTTTGVFRRIAVFTRKGEKIMARTGSRRFTKRIAMAVRRAMGFK